MAIRKKIIPPRKDHPPEEMEDRHPKKKARISYEQDVDSWQKDADDARAMLEYERTRELLPSIN